MFVKIKRRQHMYITPLTASATPYAHTTEFGMSMHTAPYPTNKNSCHSYHDDNCKSHNFIYYQLFQLWYISCVFSGGQLAEPYTQNHDCTPHICRVSHLCGGVCVWSVWSAG